MNSKIELIPKKTKIYLFLFIIFNLILSTLETIGIGSIPILILALIDGTGNSSDYFFYEFISKFFNTQNKDFLLNFSIFILLFFLLKNIYYLIIKFCEGLLKKNLVSTISLKLFKSYLFLPYKQHLYKNPSIALRNMTSECESFATYIGSLIDIFREILIIIFLFSMLFMQDKFLSFFVICVLTLVLTTFYLLVRNSLYKMGQVSQDFRGQLLKLITQSLESIRFVKILKKENFFFKKFSFNLNKILDQNVMMNIIQAIPKTLLEFIAITIMILSVYFFLEHQSSKNILPYITLLGLILVRLIPSFNILSSSISSLKFLTPAKEILQKELRLGSNLKVLKTGIDNNIDHSKIFKKAIELKKIYFKYPSSKKNNLKNINLKIKKNSFIAFVGESGAGKSTIIDVILGLLEPNFGKILIDGKNLHSEKILNSWYKNIGIIPQDIYLDDSSLKDNITFYDEKIDYKNLRKAINLSLLNDVVRQLPNKLETIIGNRGIRLSGGQIQRVGIARCMYRDPRVIIMDEATSSLDNKAEKKIIDAINSIKKGRTLISIAHRLSTIKKAELIYFVKDGRVIDCGSLTKLKRRYKDFFGNL
jgi:ABC-type multidrug transport system fused ATPase/permease subunit